MAKVDISTLPEPPIGAHLITSRKGYNHHGLYIGRGKVIHYSGMARSIGYKELGELPNLIRYGSIVKTSLNFFCDGHGYRIKPHPHPKFTGEQAVERAKKRLFERSYYIYSNNCEHFVNWCIDDEFRSPFVTKIILGFVLIGSTLHWLLAGGSVKKDNTFKFIFGSFFAVSGSFATGLLTQQALQPAEGIRARERRNRRYGRIGSWVGVLFAVPLSLFGVAKRWRLFASLSPYFVPFIGGIGTYAVVRTLDTKKRVKVREKRRTDEMEKNKMDSCDKEDFSNSEAANVDTSLKKDDADTKNQS